MNKLAVALAAAMVLSVPAAAWAGDSDIEELKATVKALSAKLEQAQGRISDLEAKTGAADLRRLAGEMKAEAGQHAWAEWLENLTFSGDLRLRYVFDCLSIDRDFAEPREEDDDRHHLQFRLRFGFEKTWLDDQVKVAFRLATGDYGIAERWEFNRTIDDGQHLSTPDPRYPDQDFTDWWSGKQIWVDLAYAEYNPSCAPGLRLVGGKMPNPFVTTDMLWDEDVNPEGVFVGYTYGGLKEMRVEPFAGIGFFVMKHTGFSGLANNEGFPDVSLMAYQLGARWEPLQGIQWTCALAYYDFAHYEENYPAYWRLEREAIGNNQTGPGPWGTLAAQEFNILNLYNRVGWECLGLPMAVTFDYAHNCGNQPHVYDRDEDPQEDAIALYFEIGQNKKKGDWSFLYKYAYIEQDAFPGILPDYDFSFGGGTNRKGHKWAGRYNVTDWLTAGVTLIYSQPVINQSDWPHHHDLGDTVTTLIVDMHWQF